MVNFNFLHFTKNATTLKSKLYGFCFLRKNFFYHTIMSGYKKNIKIELKKIFLVKNFFKIMNKILNFFSLVKFSHTIFALPFALIGFFLAYEKTQNLDIKIFIFVIFCMIFARNSAMAFNRFIDRKIDKKNSRTKKREIPSNKISEKSAIFFIIINILLFFTTTFFINKMVFFLSPIALIIILTYSYSKRFTFFCHLILGLALSLSPIGAYLTITEKFDFLPLIFSFIVMFWVSGFDIIYSLQDENFDKKENLHSIPVSFGKKKSLQISFIFHIITSFLVIYAGIFAKYNNFYWIGAIIFIALLFYQHKIIYENNLEKINIIFFSKNGIASIIFAFFTIMEIII